MRTFLFAAIAAASFAAVDRQPVVAVGGAYGLAFRSEPAPKPDSGECECGCGGTGVVGDGTIVMDCGCDASCGCKKGAKTSVQDEPVCVDGSCGKPAKSAPVARRGLFGRWR